MNARQRMSDVVKLRCNACQDLLKLVIHPGWQEDLYNRARYAVTNNTGDKDAYKNVYNEMRDKEPSEYSVEQMDVSLINKIVHDWNRSSQQINYAPLCSETRKALRDLKDDRNVTQHSNENEEEEEIYLRGIMGLFNLRRFIRMVDDVEMSLSDDVRHAYRKEYIEKINSLKDTLDNERIQTVQITKNIDRDIQKILNSDKPFETYVSIMKHYMDRSDIDKDDPEGDNIREIFVVRASDAGIKEAHYMAALHYIYIEKDPVEAVRRLRMNADAYPELPINECRSIIARINEILFYGNKLTDEMQQIVDIIKGKGFVVEWRDNKFVLPEIEKKEEENRRRRMEEAKKWRLED